MAAAIRDPAIARAAKRREILRLAALAVFVSGAVFGVEPEVRVETFDVAGAGRLTLSLLPGWSSAIASEDEPAPTIELRSGGDRDALALLTVLPPRSSPLATEEIRAQVIALGQAMLPTAEQTELEVFELAGAEAVGYLFHLTDREPEAGPEDYREVRQGALRVGEQMLSVTVLTHPGDETSVTEALAMLASARYGDAATE